MKTQQRLEFVDQIEINAPARAYPNEKGIDDNLVEDTQQSFLNAKSVVSFVSAVSGQQRNDVLNSVLLAQLAANKKFPGEDQTKEWYESFVSVLNTIGWTIEGKEFSKFSSSSDIFDIQNAIINILTAAFGGSFAVVIKETLSAIKSLSDTNGKITAFEKNTHSLTKGAFQIGLASVENGAVALQIGTFLLNSENEIKKILWFKSSSDSTTLEYCSRKGTLDEDVYSLVRESVLNKLGQTAKDYVTAIEI